MEANTDTLPLICAVIDCQGFMIGKNFHVRELGIAWVDGEKSVEFNCNETLSDLPGNVQRGLRYQRNYVHGIEVLTANLTSFKEKDIQVVVRAWYLLVRNSAQPYFACKNNQMGNILTKMGLSYVDLTKSPLKVPTIAEIDSKSTRWFCSCHGLHTHSLRADNIRCAERKSSLYWRWIENEMKEISLSSSMVSTEE